MIDALCRRGTALCRLRALARGASKDSLGEALALNAVDLLKFTDFNDAKVIYVVT